MYQIAIFALTFALIQIFIKHHLPRLKNVVIFKINNENAFFEKSPGVFKILLTVKHSDASHNFCGSDEFDNFQ